MNGAFAVLTGVRSHPNTSKKSAATRADKLKSWLPRLALRIDILFSRTDPASQFCSLVAIAVATVGCLVSPLAAGAADGASGNSDDSVTIALPRVVPGELVGDLSVPFRGPVTTTGPREKPYRPRLLSGAPPKTPEPAAVPPDKSLAPGIGLKAAVPGPIRNFEGLARLDTCAGGQCGTGTPPICACAAESQETPCCLT